MAVVAAFLGGAAWQRLQVIEELRDAEAERSGLQQMVSMYERMASTFQIEATRSNAALELEAKKAAALRKRVAEANNP